MAVSRDFRRVPGGAMGPGAARFANGFGPGVGAFDHDFRLKETRPLLAGERGGAYDLVERMDYLYVRVVKAKELVAPATGLDPFVELRLGSYSATTRHFEKTVHPEWNEVFAFSRERMQSSYLDVFVRHRGSDDGYLGRVRFDFADVPLRTPPESPLAPQWYRVVDHNYEARGELMLAVWFGTQADECFPYAVHADAITVEAALAGHVRGKVYHTPRLWYVHVIVVEAQEIRFKEKSRVGEVFVRTRVGHAVLKTKVCVSRSTSFWWNEDHWFVAAEPFEEELIVSVEDRVDIDKEEVIGHARIPLMSLVRRYDDRMVMPRWYDLTRHGEEISGKLCVRACLEGGYCVHTAPVHYSSDLRPTARELWKQPIGVLELGIHRAVGLSPQRLRDGRGSCDAYCVARYGLKWVRTRTVIDSINPRFHEQYNWDVHDHATVLTVAVFHSSQIGERGGLVSDDGAGRDILIGKVRIRVSTLETGRTYTHAYPLIILTRSGVKKTGELHLAVRFSSASTLALYRTYVRPTYPRKHYTCPMSVVQQESLRTEAVKIVAHRFGRMEPPLRREVVEHICDVHVVRWSMRRSKANFYRLLSALSFIICVYRWFVDVCSWKSPVTTVLVHIIYTMLVCFPNLIFPTFYLYIFLIGLWNYRWRPRHPPHMDIKVSYADLAQPDELDEEFDEFPTAVASHEVVRMRYDRLRSLAARLQAMAGDLATHAERLASLMTWRDPRATAMFLMWCLSMAVLTYVAPYYPLALIPGWYLMRHPRLRSRTPMAPLNYFRRLPSRTECLL